MLALEHLMGAYFHQDWDLDGGTITDTVNAFMAGAPTRVEPAIEDIDRLLALDLTDADLRSRLEDLGCDYYPGDSEDAYRSWLTEIRAMLAGQAGQPLNS